MTRIRKGKKPAWMGPSLDEMIAKAVKKRPALRAELRERRLIAGAAILVRKMREAAGMTQQELAKRAGMHQSAIARLESAKSRVVPTLGTLAKIAAATGIPLRIEPQVEGLSASIDLSQDENGV